MEILIMLILANLLMFITVFVVYPQYIGNLIGLAVKEYRKVLNKE